MSAIVVVGSSLAARVSGRVVVAAWRVDAKPSSDGRAAWPDGKRTDSGDSSSSGETDERADHDYCLSTSGRTAVSKRSAVARDGDKTMAGWRCDNVDRVNVRRRASATRVHERTAHDYTNTMTAVHGQSTHNRNMTHSALSARRPPHPANTAWRPPITSSSLLLPSSR